MNAQRRCGPMSTLNGLAGAWSLTAVSVVAPTLAMSRAEVRDGPARRAQQRAHAADHLARDDRPLQQGLAEQLGAARQRPRRPRGLRRRHVEGVRRGVEQDRRDVNSGDAVDERVVGLGYQREALARETLDEPDLPQRLGAVQALGEQASRELGERGLVGRARQRGVAYVVARVEVGVISPHRPPLTVGDVREALAVAGDEVQAAEHVVGQLLQAGRIALEDHHRRDVHVRGRAFLQL